jgi:hypothetical protein
MNNQIKAALLTKTTATTRNPVCKIERLSIGEMLVGGRPAPLLLRTCCGWTFDYHGHPRRNPARNSSTDLTPSPNGRAFALVLLLIVLSALLIFLSRAATVPLG